MKKTGVVHLPRPHPGQVRVIEEAKRFNWLSAGRRWYKTTLLMALGVRACLEGKRVFIGAPTHDQVRLVWNETKKAVGGISIFNQARMEVRYGTGGSAVFRSLDEPDNAKGHTADLILLDETGLIKPEAWYEVLRPMLMSTGGDAWLAGTPVGRNWFWKGWREEKEDSMSWQLPTLGVEITKQGLIRKPHPYENPHIPFEEMLAYYNTVPEQIFRQEVLAEFITDSGTVFRNIDYSAKLETERQGAHKYIFGVDLAKSKDWTVISVINVDTKQQCHIDRFNKIDYVFQLERLQVLYDKFKPELMVVERNAAGEPFVELLERRNLPIYAFTTTNKSKKQIIENLSLAFERSEIKLLDDTTQRQELEAFEVNRLPSGLFRYSAPTGVHDDTVIALALAYWGMQEIDSHKIEFTYSPLIWDWRG